MKANKLAIVVFVWTLIVSAALAYPFYSLVLVDLFKGTIADWALASFFSAISLTAFGGCIFSFVVLFRDPSEVGKKTNIALSLLLGLTFLGFCIYLMLLYAGSKY